jgi:hypothetical protein
VLAIASKYGPKLPKRDGALNAALTVESNVEELTQSQRSVFSSSLILIFVQ